MAKGQKVPSSSSSLIPAEAQKLVGKVVFRATGRVTLQAMRRFAQTIGDPNPLWLDEAYARKTRFRGLVAAPLFDDRFLDHDGVETQYAVLENGSREMQPGQEVPLQGLPHSLAGAREYEFLRPIRPGDVLTVERKIVDLQEKRGSRGPMVLIWALTTMRDQKGRVVCRYRSCVIRMAGDDRVSTGVLLSSRTNGKAYPPRQLYGEEVRVGMEVTPLVKRPTTPQLAMLSGLMWLWHRIHYDQAFARANGCPDVLVHGPLQGSFLAQMLTDWIGLGGTLRRLGYQNRRMAPPSDTLTCRGRVTAVRMLGREARVTCDVWVENQRGEITTAGTAEVALPRRPSLPRGVR